MKTPARVRQWTKKKIQKTQRNPSMTQTIRIRSIITKEHTATMKNSSIQTMRKRCYHQA